MGTRWRGMLAPIDTPTGDGRRMARGAFRSRPLPLALKWQRIDEAGHDTSVVIGLMDRLDIDETAGEVWAEGELFDDQPELARLSQDVAEAMLLTEKRVIGPSVDAGAAEMVFVREGTDEPLTDADWEELMRQEMETGEPAPIEMLFTDYEIAAATLVSIPAFVEARPFQLLPAAEAATEPAAPVEDGTAAARLAVLTAAAAGPVVLPADVFTAPATAPAYQLPTVEEPRDGEAFRRLSGYMAPFGACHVGFRDVCITPPPAGVDYALFHRYPVDTADGLVGAGRITTGLGQVGSGCTHLTCSRNDDHACRQYTLAEAITHHDQMRTVALVRATEYAGVGIWVQGIVADDATDDDLAVLGRQRVSGDWREHAGHLEMVELLALAREEPGFPIPQTVLRSGRQFSLIAAGAMPPPDDLAAGWGGPRLPEPAPAEIVEEAAAPPDGLVHLVDPAAAEAVSSTAKPCEPIPSTDGLTAADAPPEEDCQPGEPGCEDMPMPMTVEHTGAMVALRMTDDDAARLAVEGGEPAEELHITLVYLGEAADINAASRQALIDSLTALAAEWHTAAGGELELAGDVFSISAFNPAGGDRDPCIVLGVSGEQIAAAHAQVTDAVKTVFGPPAQHLPYVPHVTVAYTDDLSLVGQLADRTGPVTFDRLRIAFAGSNHDIPLTGPGPAQEPTEPDVGETEPATAAAALLAEVEAALAAPAAHERARAAAALLTEIEEVAVGV